MSVFDFLISKENKEPKDIEYIYNHHMIWVEGTLKSFPFEKGSIVTDVVKKDNNSYELKFQGKTFVTNHGWSLIENTPDNAISLKNYNDLRSKIEDLRIIADNIFNNIKTLK